MTQDFVARYRPGAGTSYAIRNWILAVAAAAVFAAILVPAMIVTQNTVVGIIGGFFGFIAVLAPVVAAVRAPAKWNTDDRLAIAISDAGVTLAGVGLITWDRIIGFKVFDMGLLTANISYAAAGFFGGTRNNQEIVVFVRDDFMQLAGSLPAAARRHLRPGIETGTSGFAGAWGHGLTSPSFGEVAQAVEAVAAERGLPVAH